MRSCYALLTAVLAGAAVARIRPIGPAGGLPTLRPPFRESLRESRAESAPSQASQGKRVQSDFLVKSSALPLVTFQLQNSYAGRLPISAHINETRQLSFWYWPSSTANGSNKLSIWLNGGPGCSSFFGAIAENGPISFKDGARAPTLNKYAWTTVSDMLYIEQPVGTGFSLGVPNITNESQLADQFYGFLQQFYTVFPELIKKELYITGESYAGVYIPYITSRILHASATEKEKLPLNLQSFVVVDGVYSSYITSWYIPAAAFALKNQKVMGLNDSFVRDLQKQSVSCGYQAILDASTYPPKGMIPLPNGNKDEIPNKCDTADKLYAAARAANPCYNIYRVTDKCPTPPGNTEPYFSRPDVQAALHFDNFGKWYQCSNTRVFVNNNDDSDYSEVLFPDLLQRLPKGFSLWHGTHDGVLFSEGTKIAIQNLTWAGQQGFQQPITTPFVVGGKRYGTYRTERKLTFIEFENSGHMIPQDQPLASLHAFTWMLNGGNL